MLAGSFGTAKKGPRERARVLRAVLGAGRELECGGDAGARAAESGTINSDLLLRIHQKAMRLLPQSVGESAQPRASARRCRSVRGA